MIILELFGAFFYVGLFAIGGGYAAMALIEHQVVEIHKWLSVSELADIVTLSQLTPGPVALNAASFVGTRTGGIAGAVAATLGCVAPSCIIISVIAALYGKYRTHPVFDGTLFGLRPATVGMIAAAGLSLLITSLTSASPAAIAVSGISLDPLAAALFCVSFILLRTKKIQPVAIMLCCGAVAAAVYAAAELL